MALTIYWDMDDVQAQWFEYAHRNYMVPRNLTDFHTQVAGTEEFETWYKHEVEENNLFMQLQASSLLPEMKRLMLKNKELGGTNRILTSLAGQRGATALIIMTGKMVWLNQNYGNTDDYFDDVVFVSKNSDKKFYCDNQSLLVDDHHGNITEWNERAERLGFDGFAVPLISHEFSRHYKTKDNEFRLGFIETAIQSFGDKKYEPHYY